MLSDCPMKYCLKARELKMLGVACADTIERPYKCRQIKLTAAIANDTATAIKSCGDFSRSERRAPIGPPMRPPRTSGTALEKSTSCWTACVTKPTGDVNKIANCDVALIACAGSSEK